ncbi:MAG: hypothetical protein AMS27_00830 [Bacteroides sp. SM23_62_1]|nr:MAG: hypothetical protein AMS27_00830 [Bacteroides sp. SM23_62_1]
MTIIPSNYSLERLDYRKGRYTNVCKDLKGDVLLYFTFIDSRETSPWTEYDIQSTIDSVRVAIQWLHMQAKENDIVLNIIADFYIGQEYTTITKNLPSGSILNSVTEPSIRKGGELMNKWADGIARIAGSSMPIYEKEGIPEIKNPRNKERLVAYLRDQNNVESVALIFLLNNYYKSDISVQMNTMNTDDVEFAVVSYKYPTEIAHNFLHLYGAADMYPTLFRKNEKKIRFLQNEFPDEIMQDPYGKNIWDLEISEYTKYLIGWTDEIAARYEPYLTDKMMNF